MYYNMELLNDGASQRGTVESMDLFAGFGF